jgi:hypothetical protein
VAANAKDPEGQPLVYRFEVDTQPSLDSPDRQASGDVPEGNLQTSWTPPLALLENALHFWRVAASDGNTQTQSELASFLVNATNEAPTAPVPLDPVDGRTVGTATPTLRLRNAVDPEGDALTYELAVRNEANEVVAAASGIAAGATETEWLVAPALAENQSFTWSARASDGSLSGPWGGPAAFRVDAIAEPPTAPIPLLPADGAVIAERRPMLIVGNATSPDGLPLTYAFEIELVAPDGSTTTIASVEGLPEQAGTTAWSPPDDLADANYTWRARASDPRQSGPWSTTFRFQVRVDPPPAAPTGLQAVAGDQTVHLQWNVSPEPDVTGYHVYRSTTAGGGYDLVAATTTSAFDDVGLTNGVTYYYVVTAVDASNESAPSSEASARPEHPTHLIAQVWYEPATIAAECLVLARIPSTLFPRAGAVPDQDAPKCPSPENCPTWLYANVELPAGHNPSTIDRASLRLLGSIAADPHYWAIVDGDNDGVAELRVRFRFSDVAPLLSVGSNLATIVGTADGLEFQGTGSIHVTALAPLLWITPRTIQRRSNGLQVQARLTFPDGLWARDVSIDSIRLNEIVPVDGRGHAQGHELVVKFPRDAVIGVLPLGDHVEVRVSGTIRGLPFVGVDHVRVIE